MLLIYLYERHCWERVYNLITDLHQNPDFLKETACKLETFFPFLPPFLWCEIWRSKILMDIKRKAHCLDRYISNHKWRYQSFPEEFCQYLSKGGRRGREKYEHAFLSATSYIALQCLLDCNLPHYISAIEYTQTWEDMHFMPLTSKNFAILTSW